MSEDDITLTPLAGFDVVGQVTSPVLGALVKGELAAKAKKKADARAKRIAEIHGTGQARVKSNPLDIALTYAKRPPPKEWVEALRRISPKSDAVSWLYLTWKETPAKPDSGRWVLYECVPLTAIPVDMLTILSGVPYWEMPEGQKVGREQMVSAFQWWMFREHKVWARPFWCLQGEDGGTPLVYSEIEQKYLRMAKQPSTPPARGALSYAPWDARVERALLRRDRLYRLGGNIDRLRLTATEASDKAEMEAAEKQFRKDFFAWFGDRLKPQTEFMEWYTRKTEADRTLRRQTREEFIAAEQLEEAYVEHGIVPTAR